MHRIADTLHIPTDVVGWVGSLFLSLGTLTASMAGIVPDPSDAAGWPFYGVLITAIVILGLSIAGILRWVATKWMQQQQATNSVISEINATLQRLVVSTDHQNKWFEDFGKDALHTQLESARHSVHRNQEQERRARHE
jgi:hypothetical protein